MVVGAPCYYTWSAAISKVIGRMEGPVGVLSTTELLGGLMTGVATAVRGRSVADRSIPR